MDPTSTVLHKFLKTDAVDLLQGYARRGDAEAAAVFLKSFAADIDVTADFKILQKTYQGSSYYTPMRTALEEDHLEVALVFARSPACYEWSDLLTLRASHQPPLIAAFCAVGNFLPLQRLLLASNVDYAAIAECLALVANGPDAEGIRARLESGNALDPAVALAALTARNLAVHRYIPTHDIYPPLIGVSAVKLAGLYADGWLIPSLSHFTRAIMDVPSDCRVMVEAARLSGSDRAFDYGALAADVDSKALENWIRAGMV